MVKIERICFDYSVKEGEPNILLTLSDRTVITILENDIWIWNEDLYYELGGSSKWQNVKVSEDGMSLVWPEKNIKVTVNQLIEMYGSDEG